MEDVQAEDIMIEDVTTIEPGEVVVQAMLKMVRLGVGGLPVVDGEMLVGIITHRDVILLGTKAARFKVEDVMSKDLVTVVRDTPLSKIIDIMVETGYQRLPVVENKMLIGLVTQSSVIGSFKRR